MTSSILQSAYRARSSIAVFKSVVSSTPLGNGNWRKPVERTPTHALGFRRFIQRGTCWICNFSRAFKAAGTPFLPLVHDANQSTRGFFHRFVIPKVLPSAPFLHGNNHEAGAVGNAQKSLGEIQNVVR